MQAWDDGSDEQLASLVQRGNTAAYGELVRRYQRAVYATAYRLVGEEQEALDVTQDAFVRGYRAFHSFDPARPFGPWIRRIATNLALNQVQRRKGETAFADQPGAADAREPGEWAIVDEAAGPEQRYLASERQAVLRQAIQELPPHYRAVIELRHFQDQSYGEIAARLGLSLSDVKSYLFRARQALRKRLEPLRGAL